MNVSSNKTEQFINTQSHSAKNTNPYYSLYQPLSLGETAPTFFIHTGQGLLSESFGRSVSSETFLSLHDFLDYGQPLVIFFSGAAARNVLHTKKLETLQANVQQHGGRLLVLTPTEPRFIKRQLKDASSITVFQDGSNEIAEAFGLYNDQNPLWQWVSGIDEEEETIPAFYVIAPDRRAVYRFVDFDFVLYRNNNYSSLPFMNALLEAVQQSSQLYQQTGLYQLVS